MCYLERLENADLQTWGCESIHSSIKKQSIKGSENKPKSIDKLNTLQLNRSQPHLFGEANHKYPSQE